jgi:hypothetical protein
MKNLILILLFLVGWSNKSYSQTYYNPSNKVDFTITIKESYKPVDYSKIGRDFNTMIQNELQRRENLKRYYDEIYFQTKNSVYSGTVLTSDNLINSRILMVQSEVISFLDMVNRLLKSGGMKPEKYESLVRNIYYTYMNSNQVFLQIVQYKYNKGLELGDQTKINDHNKLYTTTLNSIEEFRINDNQEIEFILRGLVYPNKTSGFLYDFVRSSSEGKYNTYKSNSDNLLKNEDEKLKRERKIEEDRLKRNEIKSKELIDYRRKTFDLRKQVLSTLDEKDRKRFRSDEKKFLLNNVKESFPEKSDNIKELLKEENSDFEFKTMMFKRYGQYNIDPLSFESNFVSFKFYLDCMNDFIKTFKN